MTAAIFDLKTRLTAGAAISADDTLAMRRIVWADGVIDSAEADAIFELNAAVKSSAREWVDFFVEAMKHYVVHQQSPVGYVDQVKAAWLMQRLDSDGKVDSLGELELLVAIVESGINVPESLKAYACTQIRAAVLTGTGPTRDGDTLDPGTINAAEVALLRRVLFAQAGEGSASISRGEADLLFAIKDATLGAANAPEWQTLFVQAVGAHLMAHSDYRPLSREEAARLEAFMNDTRGGIGGFVSKLAQGGLGAGFAELFGLFGTKAPAIDHDAAVAADQAITPDEQTWLTARIDADSALDPLEKALLAFVAAESGQRLPG
jgi:hypothetical protein